MIRISHSTWLALSAALVNCNGQVLDVGSTGQPLVQGDGGSALPTIATVTNVPVTMISDGQDLYWTDDTAAIVRMPAQGGPRTTIATNCSVQFLIADSANVYFLHDAQLYGRPKYGGTTFVVSDASGSVTAAALNGRKAFWAEALDQQPRIVAVKSTSVADRVVSLVAQYLSPTSLLPFQMGVTADTVFLATTRGPLVGFPLNGGTPDGGPPQTLASSSCGILLADEGAAYCVPPSGDVTRTGSDGATTPLTALSSSTAAALDATFLYFGDKPASGGMVVKIPKLGGTPTVIAHEEATALAVDDTGVYWATPKGSIRKLLK